MEMKPLLSLLMLSMYTMAVQPLVIIVSCADQEADRCSSSSSSSPHTIQVSLYPPLHSILLNVKAGVTATVENPAHTRMPPTLPLKLQVEVLGHLREWSGWCANEDSETLLSCCLVCKAWCRIAQRKLLTGSNISIYNHKQLERVVASLSSATHPIGTYVTHLSLQREMCDIAPFYLATKLSSLRRLNINGYYPHNLFVVRSLLVMHLKHFQTVTELMLSDVQFQSFWDFCRLIVALPALSTLRLWNVYLLTSNPPRSSYGRLPSLSTFPQKFIDLSVILIGIGWNWNPLWMWATPFQTRHRPFITRHDADVIWEFIQFVHSSDSDRKWSQCSKIMWSFDESHQQCEYAITSYCRDIHNLATS